MAPTPASTQTSSSSSCLANTPSHVMASAATGTQNDCVAYVFGNWDLDAEDRWGWDCGAPQERVEEEVGGEAVEEEDNRVEEMPGLDDLEFGRFAIIQVVHTGRFVDGRELVEYWGHMPRDPIDLGGVAPAPARATFEYLISCEAGVRPGIGSDDCPICREDIGTEERVVKHEKCGNTFCESCLLEWANENRGNGRHTTCPMCQGVIIQGPGGLVELERELQENVRGWFVSEGDEIKDEIERMWGPEQEGEREAETGHENPGAPAHHIDYEPSTYIPPSRTLHPDDLDTHLASLHLDIPTSHHVSPTQVPQPLDPDVLDILQVRLRPTPPPSNTDDESGCTPGFGPAPSSGSNTTENTLNDTAAETEGEAATEAVTEGAKDPTTDACPICLHPIPPSTNNLTHNLCHTTFCATCLQGWAASHRKRGEAVTCPWDRKPLRLPSMRGSGPDDDVWDYASDSVMTGMYVLVTLTWLVFSLWVYGLLVFGWRVVRWDSGVVWQGFGMVLGWSCRVWVLAVVSMLGWMLWGIEWGMTIVEVFWFGALLGLIWWLGRGSAGDVFGGS